MNKKQIAAAAKKLAAGTEKGKGPKGNVKTNDLSKVNEIVTPASAEEPIVGSASEQPQGNAEGTSASEQPQENSTDTLVLENEKPDPVKEAEELISKQTDRALTVFWHKACKEGKVTKTTLYAKETLRKTDSSVILPNPEYKDQETTPDVSPTITKDVYSLKRNKRIYYLHDVTPTDILKAQKAKEASDKAKAAEAAASETSAK